MRGLACVTCSKFFRLKKSGVNIEEGMPTGNDLTKWGPYKLWKADLYECPSCGAQIIAGFAHSNFAEHYQPDYSLQRSQNPPLITVNDCGGAKP